MVLPPEWKDGERCKPSRPHTQLAHFYPPDLYCGQFLGADFFQTGRTMTTSDDENADQPPTMAAVGADDATTFVPPPTQAAPSLAWSSEAETDEIHRQSWGLTWSRAAVLLACTSVVALAVGFGGWALMRMHDNDNDKTPGLAKHPTAMATPPPPTWMTTISSPTPVPGAPAFATTRLPVAGLPGTDDLGWTGSGYPGARCDAADQAAVMARTAQSLLVVCQIEPGDFYYRGLRLSDGATIELANAVHSSDGFDVTNPTDGTRYRIRPSSLTIAPPDGTVSSEPMLQYAAS